MLKVLILGAQGNLGCCLQESFKQFDLSAWDRSELDLSNLVGLKRLIDFYKPQVVINAAAYNAVDLCEQSDKEYEQALILNRDLPAFLADWCLERQAILVHYSTDYVFSNDAPNFLGFFEKDRPNPINRYGQSKLAGEEKILSLAPHGLNFYLIRSSKLFGPQGKSPSAKPSFFDLMLDLAKNKPEIKIVDGERSCFTYTPDLAQATYSLLQDRANSGIYHFVNEDPATWLEGAQELFKIFQLEPKIIPVTSQELARPAKRANSSVLINSRRPKLRSFKQALAAHYQSAKLT